MHSTNASRQNGWTIQGRPATPARLEALVRSISMEALVAAMDPGALGVWFKCPRCQRSRGPRFQMPRAHLDGDHLNWSCAQCGTHRTRFALERLILANTNALSALVAQDEERLP